MLINEIKPNSAGKDYICADTHGHFSLLESQLNKVGFDTKTDRLFSLGDLIDRGDESDQVLAWLAHPWFYAIQGNHERMLINTVASQSDAMRLQWFNWGGAWAEDLDGSTLQGYHRELSRLPVAIELHLSQGQRVALVHAHLPDQCDWKNMASLLHETPDQEVEHHPVISDMLWNKPSYLTNPTKTNLPAPVKNIDHVFHGHSIMTSITTIGNRTFMDLGSYCSGKIGLIDVSSFLAKLG